MPTGLEVTYQFFSFQRTSTSCQLVRSPDVGKSLPFILQSCADAEQNGIMVSVALGVGVSIDGCGLREGKSTSTWKALIAICVVSTLQSHVMSFSTIMI